MMVPATISRRMWSNPKLDHKQIEMVQNRLKQQTMRLLSGH